MEFYDICYKDKAKCTEHNEQRFNTFEHLIIETIRFVAGDANRSAEISMSNHMLCRIFWPETGFVTVKHFAMPEEVAQYIRERKPRQRLIYMYNADCGVRIDKISEDYWLVFFSFLPETNAEAFVACNLWQAELVEKHKPAIVRYGGDNS